MLYLCRFILRLVWTLRLMWAIVGLLTVSSFLHLHSICWLLKPVLHEIVQPVTRTSLFLHPLTMSVSAVFNNIPDSIFHYFCLWPPEARCIKRPQTSACMTIPLPATRETCRWKEGQSKSAISLIVSHRWSSNNARAAVNTHGCGYIQCPYR